MPVNNPLDRRELSTRFWWRLSRAFGGVEGRKPTRFWWRKPIDTNLVALPVVGTCSLWKTQRLHRSGTPCTGPRSKRSTKHTRYKVSAGAPPTTSRTEAKKSRTTLAPRITSPVTSPRYSVMRRPSTLGVVVTIMRASLPEWPHTRAGPRARPTNSAGDA